MISSPNLQIVHRHWQDSRSDGKLRTEDCLKFNTKGVTNEFLKTWYRGDTYDFVADFNIYNQDPT